MIERAEAPCPSPASVSVLIKRTKSVRIVLIIASLLIATVAGWWIWQSYEFHKHLSEARRASLEGRISAAVEELQACQTMQPEHREVLLLVARVARLSQNWSRADEFLEHYWERYGDDDDLIFERLLIKAAREETDAVLGLLNPRLARSGDEARLCRQAIVSGYLGAFRYAETEDWLIPWKAESPDDPYLLMLVGKLEEQLSKYDDAIAIYTRIVDVYPKHHEARLKLVLLLMQQRQADVALLHLPVLRIGMPNSSEVAVQWALALRQAGRTDEALEALDRALADHPNSAVALIERGTIALNDGDDARAEELLSKALQFEPGSISARNLRIQALTRLGREREVPTELEWVKKLMSDSDRLTQLINGDLRTQPNNPHPPFEIGGIALRAGQPSEAIRWYQLALKRQPDHAPTHLALAVIYHEMGNPVLATKHRALSAQGSSTR